MEVIKITELAPQLGLSSRSLRYYEEIGLIQSVRMPGEKYRYYDPANAERLRQIVVLRKMLIPLKDILRIYQSENMSVLVEVFVKRIREIDEESAALSDLKRVTDEFLQTMLRHGVTQISALPLLYERFTRRELAEPDADSTAYDTLRALSERAAKPPEAYIVRLAPMRALCSLRGDAPGVSDPDGFWRYARARGAAPGEPGRHEQFLYQFGGEDVSLLRVPEDFVNDGDYEERRFEGGLFAAVNAYLDEDLAERLRALVACFDENPAYQIDFAADGGLRQPPLLETLLSPNEGRALVALYVPVKPRLPDLSRFAPPEVLAPGSITLEEIERANPVLWSEDVAMDKLIPINSPHYRVTEAGEAEYISWIATRVLSTGVEVRLPFRVDVEFRVGEESGGWGHDRNETSIRFHHGEDVNFLFGVNMDNNPDERLSREAICFHQPVFGDYCQYPGLGRIEPNAYNRLTWIVGLRHFAVAINGEVRYCGERFPYMALETRLQRAQPIVMGSDGSVKKFFRAIRVSQLASGMEPKLREGALSVAARRSNRTIPNVHRLITSEFGENYWFNGCARYAMESLGAFKEEPDFGYWFFAALTGDAFTQAYAYGAYTGEAASSCLFNLEGGRYLERVFEKCGCASRFVPQSALSGDAQACARSLMAQIDRGVPVVAVTREGPGWGVYVGYEAYGHTLLYLTGDSEQPSRVPLERAVSEESVHGWLFVGEKTREIELKQVYREAVAAIPRLFSVKNAAFCFGAEAFRAWAEKIERGDFEAVTPETFDAWTMHTNYVCMMATNGSCLQSLLERTRALNPDLDFLERIGTLYRRTAEIWNADHGEDLEALGGGFNVTLEALQNPARRAPIAAKIREAARCMDEVERIIRAKLPDEEARL